MLAQVSCFGRKPRGSPDFLAYHVPETCMHALGTGVPRCLVVAPSASSPKAAQDLLRRLKLHGQNAPKTASPRHCQKIVPLGGAKTKEPKFP